MLSVVPLDLYEPIYYHILLIVIMIAFFNAQRTQIGDYQNLGFIKSMGFVVFIFVLLYLGLRPISGKYFGDMGIYNKHFNEFAEGGEIKVEQDMLFQLFMKFCSQIMTASSFFFICSVIYVIPIYIISKKWFSDYWFYAFIMLAGSFSFWAYGTNGMRNGMASSLFLMAFASDKKYKQIVWLALSIGVHNSMLLPALGFVITWFYNNTKAFYAFWFLCIPLSLAMPGFWEGFFAGFISDDRATYLTEGNAYDDNFSRLGFRWDFLLYSASGVVAGWYYIFRKKMNDPIYNRLFNTFLFANAFWILVIRANFSNRFAYLSWFLLALVIVYPWIKYKFNDLQTVRLAWILVGYYSFTYIMNVFIYA